MPCDGSAVGAGSGERRKKRAERLSRPARVSQPKETAEPYLGAIAAASSEIRGIRKFGHRHPHPVVLGGQCRPAHVASSRSGGSGAHTVEVATRPPAWHREPASRTSLQTASGLLEKRLLIQLGFTLIFFAAFSARPEWPPPTFPLVVAIPPPLVRDKLAPKSSSVRNLEPGAGCAVVATVRKLLRRVTLKNGVNTNVRTASRAIGGVLWYPWPWFSVLRRNCSFQAKSTLSSRNTLKSIWPLWTRTRT